MDKYIGKMLDNRYEILEVIGRGGMAVVYKAKCHRLNRFVAVKILKEELAQDEEFRRRFRDESQAVAMLSHPNIVSVYDVSRTGDVEYIVMELIDGITLKDYMERKSPLGWKETVFFALQIAKALEHAHGRGIIHRDIKPQNIMVLRDGTVKVADFGIARQAASNNTYNMREAIGSVYYVSPEQARGGHIDNRSDIYSLGVVMYEMLTGRLPFEGDTPLAVALQHINSVPLPPRDHVPDIPKTLEDIVMKAMAPQPADRYRSATDMIRDMENFRDDPHYKIDVAAVHPVSAARSRDPEETQVIQYSSELQAAAQRKNAQRLKTAAAPVEEDDEEEEEEERGKRRISSSLIFTILAIAIFAIGAGFFIFAVINPFGSDKKTENETTLKAPSLVGKVYQDVIADPEITEQGIIIKEKTRIYDKDAKEGEILSQDPKAGEALSEDKVIYVEVCKGAPAMEMVDVVGQTSRQAELDIKNAATKAGITITVQTQEEYSDDDAEDTVIRTVPEKGEELSDGDVVTLYVSMGPEIPQKKTPNFLQWNINDVTRSEVKKYGLTMGSTTEVESSQPAGTIVGQSPEPGNMVDENTPLNFEVSKGPQQKEVTITQVITLVPSEDDPTAPIRVVVEVDGEVAYEKEHDPSEGTVSVRLKALEGDHEVHIMENGQTISRETVTFQ